MSGFRFKCFQKSLLFFLLVGSHGFPVRRRRVLEMCCFMEKMLASMLADFEVKVEKEVLEPLNKLSEVRAAGDGFTQKKWDVLDHKGHL